MDTRERYQRKADEIAGERYGKDFYDLLPETREAVYCQAVMDVDDDIISQAEWLAERRWEAQYDRL